MTENMIIAICSSVSFVSLICIVAWLENKRDERDAEKLYFSETGKMPKRYLK